MNLSDHSPEFRAKLIEVAERANLPPEGMAILRKGFAKMERLADDKKTPKNRETDLNSRAKDLTIRVIGKEPLVPRSGIVATNIPQRWKKAVERQKGLIFTLPSPLLKAVVKRVGNLLSDDAIEMEEELSEIMGDHSFMVGYWKGGPIMTNVLAKDHLDPSNFEAEKLGLNSAQLGNNFRTINRQLDFIHDAMRGYAGWLLLNPQFLSEHRRLASYMLPSNSEWNWSKVGKLPSSFRQGPNQKLQSSANILNYFEKLNIFLKRWRLQSLSAPYLPEPLSMLFAGESPSNAHDNYKGVGSTFSIADTFPFANFTELRSQLRFANNRNRDDQHLQEWKKLISTNNPHKVAIRTYARRFELMHYLRTLYSRYSRELYRCMDKFEDLFSDYFDVSKQTIHLDLHAIRRKIGKDWLTRKLV